VRYTYLLIDFLTVFFPLAFSFDSRVRFYTRWQYFMPGLFFTAVFFLIWDYFKTKYGVWSFSDRYVVGIRFFGMPIEEYLFFIVVPYACTFIYESLRCYHQRRVFPDTTRYVVWIAGGIMFVASFFFIHRAYTFSVLFLLGLIFPLCTLVLQKEKLDRFLLMYLISLLPMFIVNGLLTALPVVIYDDTQNLGIRVGTIPVEDFLYSAILLLMNVSIYEWCLKRET
jgi:lycopene cyclase domain-containing protein